MSSTSNEEKHSHIRRTIMQFNDIEQKFFREILKAELNCVTGAKLVAGDDRPRTD